MMLRLTEHAYLRMQLRRVAYSLANLLSRTYSLLRSRPRNPEAREAEQKNCLFLFIAPTGLDGLPLVLAGVIVADCFP
ncbi:hypothetical protein ACSS6W_002926 [Trichoderma asperelloides]